MTMLHTVRRSPRLVILLCAVLAVAAVIIRQQVANAASSLPANKMTVTAADNNVQGPGTTQTILKAQMKTSNPADLLLQVTSECTILSNITNMGTSDMQAYSATVQLSAWIDGNPIPVVPPATNTGASGSGPTIGDSNVVFCNREFQRTTMFDSQNESIQDIEQTEQSNAFQWVALNVGATVHTIEIKATFTDTNTADAEAHGVISKRSLTADVTNYVISQPSA